jgi:hypothetical protein
MKWKCHVDGLFDLDQIEHYGRVFLEKVVQWCKMAYEKDQAYWDEILEHPPLNEQYEEYVQAVHDNHKPQKLKDMNIVPRERPDKWPCDYFAEARGKTSVSLAQLIWEQKDAQKISDDGNAGVRGDKDATSQPQDAETSEQTRTRSGTSPTSSNASSQTTVRDWGKKQGHAGASTGEGGGGGDDDDDDSDPEDKKLGPHDSKAPKSPKSKKKATSDRLEVPGAFVNRRVKSESDSPGKDCPGHLCNGNTELLRSLWTYLARTEHF